jgi:hypothetical protein
MADFEDDDLSQGAGLEPTPGSLAHWLEEQYQGDDRFESIEIDEPGPLEGEAVRVKFICDERSHFFVSVLEDESLVRVGLGTGDRWASEAIETAALETGDSLTEFLADSMDADDELEHEVKHFHDDMFYFCSDIPYQRVEDLASDHLRDELIYYLDGYMTALFEYLEVEADEAGDEDEEEEDEVDDLDDEDDEDDLDDDDDDDLEDDEDDEDGPPRRRR